MFDYDPICLDEILKPPAWQRDALCLEYASTTNWFPERGESSLPAKNVCYSCMVRTECLAFAADNNIEDGIFGGLSGPERVKRRRAA